MKAVLCLAVVAMAGVPAAKAGNTLDLEERALIIRGLTAEFGSAKITIPRSKKPLKVTRKASYDVDEWSAAMEKFGPAARLGDLVQITDVRLKDDKVILVLNHGIKGGRKWWHRVQVSGGTTTGRGTSIGANQAVYAPGGTTLALVFDDGVPSIGPDDVKALLKPLIDFEQRSATELYMDSLPEEVQEAITDKRVTKGMDRDMVLLARGRPDKKYRDFQDGIETEDWIYGTPPGSVTFVTFEDGEVVRIRETFATLGGEVKKEDPIQE